MNVVTLAELAESFKISETEAEALRRRHRWPHLKIGRKNVRFTDAQVAAIIAQHTESAAAKSPVAVPTMPARGKKSA